MKPVKGHAFERWEVAVRWTRTVGTMRDAIAHCQCGEFQVFGVLSLGSARQWHREHKAAVLEAPKGSGTP